MSEPRSTAVSVGVVTALVGFTSSFAVVLAGLRAVGATAAQASAGLIALCVLQGLGTVWLSRRYRRPITLAWSTPGAALLVTASAVSWRAAVGAFLVTGLLIAATGLWGALGRLVSAIPVWLAHAMLAGILLPLCAAPVLTAVETPVYVVPVIVVWLAVQRYAPRWSTPAAFGVAIVVAVVFAAGEGLIDWPDVPGMALTGPAFELSTIIGIALPLYVVTMASQNVPGAAVLAAAGYTAPWRPTMLLTGLATVVGAPAGAHALNLAAITAALPASPEAHPDPAERWRASQAAGWTYVVLAPLAPALIALIDAGPGGLVESVAGLALLTTFAASLHAAMSSAANRIPAALALVLAATGLTIAGVGSAFWALVVGLVVHAVLRPRAAARTASVPRQATDPQDAPAQPQDALHDRVGGPHDDQHAPSDR